jgi:hypothetical protein
LASEVRVDVTVRFILSSVLLPATGNVRAQSDRTSIAGAVRDASGDVLAGVQVNAANSSISLLERVKKNRIGVDGLRKMPAGEYALRWSKAEFRIRTDELRSGGEKLSVNCSE